MLCLCVCSTIRRLEEEVRHLDHVNNRLHSQITHYDTGYVCTFVYTCSNTFMYSRYLRLVETLLVSVKVCFYKSRNALWIYTSLHYSWPTEPTVKHHGHVTRSPQPDRSRNTPHRSQDTKPNKSPVPLTETHHTSNKSPAHTPQSVNRPLTRKKWLESSVPGLLFGGPDPEEKLPPSQCESVHNGWWFAHFYEPFLYPGIALLWQFSRSYTGCALLKWRLTYTVILWVN